MSLLHNKHEMKSDESEVNFIDLFHLVWGNKWLIMGVMFIAISISVFYVKRLTPTYASDILLQIETGDSRYGAGSGMQLVLGGGKGDIIATQMALIKSRYILEPVIEKLGLNINFGLIKQSFWKRLFFQDRSYINVNTFEVKKQDLNKEFTIVIDGAKHFTLYDSEKSIILSGRVGEVLANDTRSIKLRVNKLNASIGSTFYLVKRPAEAMVVSLASGLKISELGDKLRSLTGILSVELIGESPKLIAKILNAVGDITHEKDAQKKAVEASQTLKFMQQQLPITKNALQKAEKKLNMYRSNSGKIDMKTQTDFLLRQLLGLDSKIDELKLQRNNMMNEYTKAHPAYIALNQQIQSLITHRDALEHSLKILPSADQIMVNLLRDVNVKKSLYLIILNKIQELKVIKAGTVSSVRILSYAKVPDVPLPRHSLKIYLEGAIFGFLISVALVYIRKISASKVSDPHWSEKHFNLANLAIVPYCAEQSEFMVGMNKSKELPLLADINPKSHSIEALRSLRTSLQISLACAKNNLVSILGIAPGVGKSFVSVNLAFLLASAGKKVLLIDADMRRGTLHKYLTIPSAPGLAEVLKGSTSLEGALVKSRFDNLYILPRGVYPEDPSELLTNNQFNQLLDLISPQYDVVIIDTAPVLLVTDAVVVSAKTATNYLVIGAGAHQPEEISLAIKRVMGAGIEIQGSIYNFHSYTNSLSKHYGKYSYYAGKYKYYYDDSAQI